MPLLADHVLREANHYLRIDIVKDLGKKGFGINKIEDISFINKIKLIVDKT